MKKRVLIITYYWPPSAGSGVQRWLKFAKYLPEFDWEPVIFTPENPDFDLKDQTLLEEISQDLEVLKIPIWEPYQLLNKIRGNKSEAHPSRLMEKKNKSLVERLSVWARANLLIPDPRVFWVKPSVKFLSDLASNGQFQAIITTGPPHSMHLIGEALHKKFNIPWVADFRDPWSEWEFLDELPMRDSARRKHKKLEEKVIRGASRLITISPTFQKSLKKLSGRSVDLLTNGFDPADLPNGFERKESKKGGFHLVYTGIIDSIRNPIPLLKAFKEEFGSTSEKVKITFVGRVSEGVKEFVNQDNWLKGRIDFPGYVSHEEVFEFYAQADALLLILTNTKNAQGNIPGKLFEYMSTRVPILALGDPRGDSADILKKSKAGEVIAHRNHSGIQVALRRLYSESNSDLHESDMDQYSRRNLTQSLAKILDESTLS